MRRTLCVIWLSLAAACYSPALPEGRPCSETDQCPIGQSCDPALGVCASFAPCETPGISDSFDDGEPCAPWGQDYGNATVGESGGALAITPSNSGANDGGCEGDREIPFEDGGVFVQVARPLAPGHGYTAFRVYVLGAPSPQLAVSDDILSLASFGGSPVVEVPFDPAAMSWWRVRPDREAGNTVAEYSGDGSHWSLLGALDGQPSETIRIALLAGVAATDPDPGTAEFRNLGVCPASTEL